MEKNIFSVGTKITVDKMIGYKRYLDKLEKYVNMGSVSEKGSVGVSVSGMHQIGKTSLLCAVCDKYKDSSDYFCIYTNFGRASKISNSLFLGFLRDAIGTIKREARRKCLEDNDLTEQFEEFSMALERGDVGSAKNCFEYVVRDIGEYFHTVLVIDEFDAAKDNFEDNDAQFLRDLMYYPENNISLFIISRRNVKNIVHDNGSNSPLANAIKDEPVCGFNKDDIDDFYKKLSLLYGIELNVEEKEKIFYYAGIVPRNYALIGKKLVDLKLDKQKIDVDNVCLSFSNDFYEYYSHVYERLKKDGKVSTIYGATIGPKIGISEQDVKALEAIGYLSVDVRSERYFSFSWYFVEYLRNKELVNIDEWHELITLEKNVKKIVREQFRAFGIKPEEKKKYEKFLQKYYEEDLNKPYDPKIYNSFMFDASRNFKQHPQLIDVMSLDICVKAILLKLWNNCFEKYFDPTERAIGELYFKECCKARNPLAHGHEDYLTVEQCNLVKQYSKELNNRIQKNMVTLMNESTEKPSSVDEILKYVSKYTIEVRRDAPSWKNGNVQKSLSTSVADRVEGTVVKTDENKEGQGGFKIIGKIGEKNQRDGN